MLDKLRDALWDPHDEHGAAAVDAAVLIPLLPADAGYDVVLTTRADHLPSHPGQVSFPGGYRQAGETPLDAALREAEEEIALPPKAVDVLGHLGDVSGPGWDTIRPHVGLVTENVEFVADPSEVDEVITIGLDVLASADVYEGRMLDPASDVPWAGYTVNIFHIEPRPVWGFTGGLVARLLELATGWEPPSAPKVVRTPDELRDGLP